MHRELKYKFETVFESKEQYMAFKRAWKKLHADGFPKPEKVPQKTWGWGDDRNIVGYHNVSKLNVKYHLVYAAALGKSVEKMFPRGYKYICSWIQPSFYWTIRYTKIDYSVFGDALNPEQIAKIEANIKAFMDESFK